MKELYWMTILSNISIMSGIILFFAVIAFVAFSILYYIEFDPVRSNENNNQVLSICGKCAKSSLITVIVCTLLCVFIPSKKDMLIIYGVGGAIDYIQDNDKAKELPNKVIDACDAYFESVIDKTE